MYSIWTYLDYWGKADADIGGHHPAAFHCLDVAAVAETILTGSPRLRARLSDWLRVAESELGATLAVFVALHDIGKFDTRFQSKAPDVARGLSPRWQSIDRRLGLGFDHGAGGYGHLLRDHNVAVTHGLGPSAWPLLQAVTGHHGELPGRRRAEDSARWNDLARLDLRNADRTARSAYLGDALALFVERGAALPLTTESGSPLVMLLAGLCSVADWIGSSVDFFPYASEPRLLGTYYVEHALPRARVAVAALGLRVARPSGSGFGALFGFPPRDVQRVTETLDLPDGPCLVVVEAQMGSGKTEAALSLAERFLARGDASGIYVALPTMATSNAMLDRLERNLPKMFQGHVNLVLSHGRRRLHEGFQRVIARHGPEASAYEDEATVVCSRWLLGRKRALLGQVGVGTVDQAMLAALRVRHHFVRAYALADSVVVLDEIHAYDAYMQVILERLVEWLGALGAPVVLLSATLPSDKRRRFVEAYAGGAGFAIPAAPERAAAAAPYPLVTMATRGAVSERTLGETPVSTFVELSLVYTGEPEEDVLPRLIEAVGKGAMVAWIRNTVTEAQGAWERARALGAPFVDLFHARMRAIDRADVERRVLAAFGKTGERRGILLIATQVVEQSLDLDFDLLATDLCPIDLVLQRAGRLHRHVRDRRPAGCEAPRLLVVAPTAGKAAALDFDGSGYVYDPATLGLTLDVLAERAGVAIPSDIRGLVEAVYDPGSRAARIDAATNAGALRDAETKRQKKLDTRQSEAKRACIAPATFDPAAAEVYYADDDETVQALTRDGDSTTLLLVLWDGETGRPLDGGEPWTLDTKRPSAWQEAHALVGQMVSVPAYPWERIERGARARGEAHLWEEWVGRAGAFLRETGLGEPVVVPMRDAGEGEWRGSVETTRGEFRRLAYSVKKGLSFPRQESKA